MRHPVHLPRPLHDCLHWGLLWGLLLALTLAACRSTPNDPQGMYRASMQDLDPRRGRAFTKEALERQARRYDRVATWYAEGRLETAADFYYSSAVLVNSNRVENMSLAKTLAIRAAELGERRGFTVQAHATDKLLQAEGKAQRYGTVIEFVPVLDRFQLYRMDAMTTDDERRAMGVPPLSELLAEVAELNLVREQGGRLDEPGEPEEPAYAIPRTDED